ncbi:uncharacterized protein LOC114537825 isoform X2 [Dendronephthya gigantea]|nr:uncharacterized protein LOC114537825 isoform X2 [Dendronephthya gigantea]XP_028414724.1 uncharacterized protein LOC114537825 isoform X2 [Dendronephthya gigantea]
MRGVCAKVLWLTACLVGASSFTMALQMPFVTKPISKHDIFLRLNDVKSKTQPEEFHRYNITFAAKQLPMGNMSLDERCNRGLPLSVRWTNYGPYGSLVRETSNITNNDGVGLTGIFPSVINNVLKECCHANTHVVYGHYIKTLKELEKSLWDGSPEDIMFPIGLQSMDIKEFKTLPVVPLLVAPRTTLVVPETDKNRGRTIELFQTVGMAWPILLFIVLAAILSGMFMWTLDHFKNPDEFPMKFTEGVWEGFWWAIVTMTTVGYGDRAPRSILGRLFCMIWIITGMSIIAILTAMVTASLSASIEYRLVVHGSKMGAVDGSQEERIGTGMNAGIKTFDTPKDVVEALVDTTSLEVAIMDSYLLSYYHEVIKREPVRVKANEELPINYGLSLAPNSENFTQCFIRYIKNNPQDIFESIRQNLNPLKNPTDDVSEELIASQGFLGEKDFHMILYALAGFLGGFFLLGIIWEFFISKIICKTNRAPKAKKKKEKKSIFESLIGFRLSQNPPMQNEDRAQIELIQQKTDKVRQLIREYEEFYESWMEKLKEATEGSEDLKGFGPASAKWMMVTHNGNNGNPA